MARTVKDRTKGYDNDCTTLSRIAVAVKLDPRITPKVKLEVVRKLDEVVLDLAAVTEKIRAK